MIFPPPSFNLILDVVTFRGVLVLYVRNEAGTVRELDPAEYLLGDAFSRHILDCINTDLPKKKMEGHNVISEVFVTL